MALFELYPSFKWGTVAGDWRGGAPRGNFTDSYENQDRTQFRFSAKRQSMRARIFVAFLCGSPKMKARRLSTTP